MPVDVTVELGDWERLREPATAIRERVFVQEQKVPVELELDEFDALSLHAVARDEAGRALGTARLLPDAHIGRMAVLAEARGSGVGSRLLLALIDAARARGEIEVVLNAQTHALPFYGRFGFVAEGEEFDDAGIAHRVMRKRF